MSGVSFEHVTKVFGGDGRPAVDDCSFEVNESELVVLLGPSGCGKTTLLKTVNRLVAPTSGIVRVGGEDVRHVDVTSLRRSVGYVIQHVGLFPHMTVAQNVETVPRLLGWDEGKRGARVDELLEVVGLDPASYRSRFPDELSGGQKQRVGIARALAARPRVLLMDEPFGALDAITRADMQEEMLSLRRNLDQTVLFVTHDVDEALRLADRIVVMNAGRVVQYSSPLELLASPANDFVRELVGAGDAIRLLGLYTAAEVMTADASHHPEVSVGAEDSLRTVLAAMLTAGAESASVVDDGRTVGSISLDSIRQRARSA